MKRQERFVILPTIAKLPPIKPDLSSSWVSQWPARRMAPFSPQFDRAKKKLSLPKGSLLCWASKGGLVFLSLTAIFTCPSLFLAVFLHRALSLSRRVRILLVIRRITQKKNVSMRSVFPTFPGSLSGFPAHDERARERRTSFRPQNVLDRTDVRKNPVLPSFSRCASFSSRSVARFYSGHPFGNGFFYDACVAFAGGKEDVLN